MAFPSEWMRFAPPPRPLSGSDQWHVFLSYRSVNRAWVLNLYDVLRESGHTVFIDQCELEGGAKLKRRLGEALSKSQAGVLIWSRAARDSGWVLDEYEVMDRQADDKPGFQFVPINLDGTPLPPFAANRVYLDFSAYPDGPNGGELLRLLHAVVGKPLSVEAARFAVQQDEASRQAFAQVGAAVRHKKPEQLTRLFDEGGLPWQTSSALGCKVAEGLADLGHYDEALRVLGTLEERFAKAIRPKQLHALALARRGAQKGDEGEGELSAAQDILGALYESGERDPETLGIYARTWMDRYQRSGDAGDLEQSRDLYAEAFHIAQDDYYTGINAAAKSVLLGTEEDLARAAEYAARVQEIVGTEPVPDDYWRTATVGEVFLIRKQYADAARLYKAAVATARAKAGAHESTWTQACRLMAKLQPSAEERALVREAFEHLPDGSQPGR